ncbi:MAG: hypothetical protein RIS84_1697 [Pseudomonadota bacterium]
MKKTILSVAISCVLSASAFAAETTTTTQAPPPACPVGQTCPPPTGTQPAPTGTTQPAPTGTTQPAPTGTTQPAPTGTTQPAPTGTTQPAPTGTTQPAPTGTTKPVGQSNPALRALGVDDDKLPKLGRDDIKNLPAKALQAFDKKSLAALPPAAFGGLTTAALKQLKTDEVKQLDGKDLTKLVTNLDSTQVKPEDVKNLLPTGWTIDTATGKITPPAGSNISLPPLKVASTTASTTTTGTVETPEVADLTKAVAVGGKTDATGSVLQGVNDALKAAGVPQFTAKQNGNGVISVEGPSIKLNFLPDNKNMKQGDTKAPAGITIIEGRYVVVTPLGQLIPVIPTPKDPQGLALALGKDGGIKVDENGVVTISQKGKKSPVIFDSLATPTTASPVAGKPAGVYFTSANTGFSVYADGTAQAIKPAVAAPDTFTSKARSFSGVDDVQSNGDGSFVVVYKGTKLTIKPQSFDTTVATGATVDPSITVKDNNLVYTYQDGTDAVSQTLTVK